jgi:WD40 repeat protein
VGFPGKGRIIALGMQSQAVVVWDLLSGKRLNSDAGHAMPITGTAFRSDGRRLYTVGMDGGLIEWDLAGKEVRRVAPPRVVPFGRGFGRPTMRMTGQGVFSPTGAYLASSDRSAILSVRDVQTGQDVLALSSVRSSTQALAFSRNDLLAVSASDSRRNNNVRLFRMESGEELPGCETRSGAPSLLAFGPAGRRLAMGLEVVARGGTESQYEIRVWRTDLGRDDPTFQPFPMPSFPGSNSGLVFSPDGNYLLVAEVRGVIHVLDARTGREVDILNINETITTPPIYSPDGRSLVIASSPDDQAGHNLALWEMASGKKRWLAHLDAAVTALAFAPSGKLLVTGHRDSAGLVWDVTGQSMRRPPVRLLAEWDDLWVRLVGEDAEVAFLAQRILAGQGDATVAALRKRLEPVTGKPPTTAEVERLIRQLDDEEFAVRRQAFDTLASEGKLVEDYLRKALLGKPSAELKRRVHELIARMGRPGVSGDQLRGVRALEVLEWIGTAQARRMVQELSRGRSDSPLTRDAVATLERMK